MSIHDKEYDDVKIALTAAGSDLDAPLDDRFGRAPQFIIYDLEADTYEVIDNRQNVAATQGAGVQAAQTVAHAGVAGLITGHCGPKAFRALQAAGIAIYNTEAATVAEALTAFRDGRLMSSSSPDVQGHWA